VRLRRLPELLIAGLACAYVLALPLAIGRADESHLLFEARRVFDGQAPYRDFFESLTPLSLYLFAAVYAVAGTTLLAARAAIAVVVAIAAVLAWRLAQRVAGAPEALLVTLLFVAVAVPTWPYASPHWVTTALGLGTAAVLLGERWQGAGRLRPLLAGVLAGAAVCTQQQRGAFLALWLPLALLVLSGSLPQPLRRQRLAASMAWAAVGGAVVIVAILGHAAWRASLADMLEMTVGFALEHYGPTHSGKEPWAAILPFTQEWAVATWIWLLRAAPLLVAGEVILLLRRPRRAWACADLERAALSLLAALMALSVWYLPDFIHVSFVLVFLLLPAASLLHRLRAAPWWERLPAGRAVATVAVLLGAAAVAGKGVGNQRAARAAAPVRFETAFGAIDAKPPLPQLYAFARQHLIAAPAGRSLVYSYPDDAWFYLTLPADNPSAYSILVPGMFPAEAFASVVEILRARRPDMVLLCTLVLGGPEGEAVQQAVDAGYDLAGELQPYRAYVRRAAPAPAPDRGA
jgi:hypothetical protein